MFFGVAVFLVFGTLETLTQDITARADVDSTTYLLGDPIRVSIGITHPPGVTFTPLFTDTVGGFSILGWDGLQSKDETTSEAGLVVAWYDSGIAILPPLTFSYRVPGDTTDDTVGTNPLLLTIELFAVDTTQPIKDLKPPLTIPLTLSDVATVLGIVLALAAAVFLIYRYWKKKRRQKPEVIFEPPPRPAHIIALEELANLREKKLWQRGLIKPYYSELTEIIRRYFEHRYGIMALEQTTEEILRDVSHRLSGNPVRSDIENVLRHADLVKFARFTPTLADHEDAMNAAYRIVETTRLTEAIGEFSSRQEAEAHAAV